MRILRVVAFQTAVLLCLVALAIPRPAGAQVAVVTQSYDNGRTGQNLQETILNTSNVNVTSFGKLFSQPVDGYIYGQPLYLPNVTIGGQVHNVVYITTQHNSVYAFDADDNTGSNASPLWHVNLGAQVLTDDICSAGGGPSGCYTDIMPYIGITSTPVIDPASGTMYLVAKNKVGSTVGSCSSYVFRLHALDVTSGTEKFGGPVEITASGFCAFQHLNRPGLLLLNGNVYVAFGSAGDFFTWHGWVMAYDAQTLAQVAVLNTTPKPASGSDGGGGIWGGGKGLLTDGTYLYVATSNGYNDVFLAGSAYTSSFLKLTTPNLTVNDYYAPDNQAYLNNSPGNVDIGSGGPILLPGTNPPEIVGGGKDGILRVMDTTHMGGYNASVNNNLQNFQATLTYPDGMIMGGPIFWTHPTYGPVIYLWGPSDYIRAWLLNGKTFNTTPVSKGTISNSGGISNLAAMSLSANGSQSGTGIVWASRAYSGDANYPTEPGILTAFDAEDLTKELWDSRMNSARDDAGKYAKFNPPTIANGKVYLAGFVGAAQVGQDSGQLLVYGLINPPDFTLTASALSPASVTPGASAASTITIAPVNGFSGDVALSCSGLPTGANCSFNPTPVPGGSGTSTLTISTAASTPVGTYAVNVGGTSGSLSHTTQLSLVVQASTGGSFTLKATPASVTVAAGTSATSTITVTPAGGFNSAVALTCSGLPAGANCSFNPTSVANGSGTSTLTINTTASTPTGTYAVTVTGTSGSVTQTTSVSLTVQAQTTGSFSLSATPLVPSAVSAGASATSAVTVNPSGGFNSTVNLACMVSATASPAPTCSLNPASVSSGSYTATLTVNTIAAHASLAASRSVFYAMLLPLGGFALLGAGFPSRKKRLLGLLLLYLALSGILLLASCGGGSSSGGGGNGGTPTGTYTVTVTGTSGSLSPQTVKVSLTVQ